MFSLLTLRKQHKDTEGGFTLVELLVVILIIGILSAIAVPIFLNQRKAAVEASLKSDMRSISQNMENCLLKDKSSYPDLWVGWAGKNITPSCFSDLKLSNGTQTHAFDMVLYPGAQSFTTGQVYCIEIASANNPGVYKFFRSDKGIVSDASCQTQ